ncbi:MAG: YdcF family protein [Opitutaceae bacterium]|nr:YdcF family protein [Cephaloticoccus sp.]MCP5530131.1 YdcF family protein [Opitutaceae bacterium]
MAAFLFWLKKAVTFWLMPLQASLTLIALGVWLLLRDRHLRSGKFFTCLGLLLLLTCSHRQVGLSLLGPLERQFPAVPELAVGYSLPPDLERCRYIVVLGGGHTDTGLLPATSQLSPYALGRLTEAVRLSRLLPEASIITCGPGAADRPTHAEILARAAQSLGVAPERFVLLDQGRDTEGEAQAIRGAVGDAPFALVTSAWHMPRAMALMRGAGLNPYPCPADFRAIPPDAFALSDWLWGIDGLEKTTWAVYERLGLAWARLRGRAGS